MNYSDDFDIAFDRLIKNEGGYVNDPRDPGGETNWGISKRSYPDLDIRHLTREQAKAIYWRDFWIAGNMAVLGKAIGFQVFDMAVNGGIQTALRLLQRAVDVAEDGHIGPRTMKAVLDMSVTDVIMRYVAHELKYKTKLSTWPVHGKGWANRAADVLLYASDDT
jgi:lysozyme family protein